MITTLFFTVLVWVVNALFSWGGAVSTLPMGVDALMVQGMSYFHLFIGFFPPLGIMLTAFLWFVAWKLLLKLVAMIPILRGVLHK